MAADDIYIDPTFERLIARLGASPITFPAGESLELASTDRSRPAVRLVCPAPLPGWTPRREGNALRATHPGSAVLVPDLSPQAQADATSDGAGEVLLEVTVAAEDALGRTVYELEPWAPGQVVRASFELSPTSSRALEKDRRDARRFARHAWVTTLLSPLLGALPSQVQQRLERTSGLDAGRATMYNAYLFLLPATILAVFAMFRNPLAVYFLCECLVRVRAGTLNEPLGTAFLALPYHLLGLPKRLGQQVSEGELSREAWRPWAYPAAEVFAPFFGLLDEPTQRALEQRYEYRVDSATPLSLWITTSFGALAVASSLGLIATSQAQIVDLVVFGAGLVLLWDSLLRWSRLRSGRVPASVLGFIVRPAALALLRVRHEPPPPPPAPLYRQTRSQTTGSEALGAKSEAPGR